MFLERKTGHPLTEPLDCRSASTIEDERSGLGRASQGQCSHRGTSEDSQSSKYLSPSHRSSRRTAIDNPMIVAQMQVQTVKAARYIANADNANESVRQKLNRTKKALSEIIALLDDTQETLNTS